MRCRSLLLLLIFTAAHAGAQPPIPKPKRLAVTKPTLDHSGQPRRGKASFYGKEFYGKRMADGTPMNPSSNIAASRTLPLGTKAVVKNLVNGKKELVEIKDRGPYIDGRIIDLSPKVAEKLGMREQGVVPVEVLPLTVPQPDGTVKLGSAAQENRDWLASAE